MMRLSVGAAALAGALAAPGLAHAAPVRGVVVAVMPARHALVVASAGGAVTTLHVTARQLAQGRIGARLVATGRRGANGSVYVTRLTRAGAASHARLRVVVVKASKGRLLVAGGGGAFAIRLKRGARVLASAAPSVAPGELVDTTVEIGRDIATSTLQTVGQARLLAFSGTVTDVSVAALQVTSDGVATTVQVPAGVTLPSVVAAGSEVEIAASVSGDALTLVTIKVDQTGVEDAASDAGVSVSDEGEVDVEGAVMAVAADSLTIQPGEGASPIVIAVPSTFALPAIAVGDLVEAEARLVGGAVTLTAIEVKDSSQPTGDDRATLGATTAAEPAEPTTTSESTAGPSPGATETSSSADDGR